MLDKMSLPRSNHGKIQVQREDVLRTSDLPFMPLKTYIGVTESFASFGYYGHARVCKKRFPNEKNAE